MRTRLMIALLCGAMMIAPGLVPPARASHDWFSIGGAFRVGAAHIAFVFGRPSFGYGYGPAYYYRYDRPISYRGYRCSPYCYHDGGYYYHYESCPLVGYHFSSYGIDPYRAFGQYAPPYDPYPYNGFFVGFFNYGYGGHGYYGRQYDRGYYGRDSYGRGYSDHGYYGRGYSDRYYDGRHGYYDGDHGYDRYDNRYDRHDGRYDGRYDRHDNRYDRHDGDRDHRGRDDRRDHGRDHHRGRGHY